MEKKTTTDELHVEVDELRNPTDPPTLTNIRIPQIPPHDVIRADKQRLLMAWESNVKTMKGVLVQLGVSQQTNMLTRALALLAMMVNCAFLYLVISKVEEGVRAVDQMRQQVIAASQVSAKQAEEQQAQLDLVSKAIASSLEARLAEDASLAKPKDTALRQLATESKTSALKTALQAKKEVSPASEKPQIEQQLLELNTPP